MTVEKKDGELISPPYIMNGFEDYERRVSRGEPDKIDAHDSFIMLQAYYVGFRDGTKLFDALHTGNTPDEIKAVREDLQEELQRFSAANRELGKKLGMGHVSTREPIRRGNEN